MHSVVNSFFLGMALFLVSVFGNQASQNLFQTTFFTDMDVKSNEMIASMGQLELCNYGGFSSLVGGNYLCKSPWRLTPRNKRDLSVLYVRYRSCGEHNVVRCNPLLYGTRREHRENRACMQGNRDGNNFDRGCCISVENENRDELVTRACNAAIFGGKSQAIKDLVALLSNEPKRLAQYILMSVAAIRGCDEGQQECLEFKDIVDDSLDYLEDTGYMENHLSDALLKLGVGMDILHHFIEELEDERLSKVVTEALDWRQVRMNILFNIFERIAQDPRTANVMERAKRNKHTRSQGYCYRYVKFALAGMGRRWNKISEGFLDTAFPSTYARNAVKDLRDRGFIDISEIGFPLDPSSAPHGSVIVYNQRNNPRHPGHIEIVNVTEGGTREYYSDFKSNKPADNDPNKIAVAIMIPVTEEDKKILRL